MSVRSFKFVLWETGGAFGDLGTLLPLLVALILVNQVSSTGSFLVVGLAYILAGLYYRIPIPVQPLKAMAAIAIATGLSASIISASGLLMAGLLLLLAVTGVIGLIAKLFPIPIIRGIQLSVAVLLIKAGVTLASKPQGFIGQQGAMHNFVGVPIGWLLAIGSGILLIIFRHNRRLPVALIVLAFGFLASILWGPIGRLAQLKLGLALPTPGLPALSDFGTALILLVIPQIPLTLGNAVFAAADTARSYFGDKAHRVTYKSLLSTMGIANLVAGLLGGFPVCHGSGGVTAHFKLGARTGIANLIIGSLFVVLALFLDGNPLPLLSLLPYPVLGVMVAFIGLQHALLIRDLRGWLNIAVVLLITLVTLVTGNLAIGFALGVVLLQRQKIAGMLRRKRAIAKDPPLISS